MRRLPLVPMALAALTGLMVASAYGTLFGVQAGAREARHLPALLGFVALLLRRDGLRGFGPAAGWLVLGAAGAVALRGAAEGLGQYGWLPGADTTRTERAFEAAWCFAVALLAWRGGALRWAGPLLAACVATTRIGGYGQALVPLLFEPTLREAALFAIGIVAGFAGGLAVLLAGGWGLYVLARVPGRRAAPGRVLAALAVAAGIGHMLLL